MPLDSVTVSALTRELREQLIDGKIDKVQQPERDTILLSIHAGHQSVRLAICGGVGNARLHLTRATYENPAQPPMFCMLLRKHLTGARIRDITQPQRERLVILDLDAHDEMGAAVDKRLAIEMIGRGTNIILIGPEGHIIDCLRRVDADMSALRQVLPGLRYRLPIAQTKPDFFSISSEARREIWARYPGDPHPDKFLLDQFACLSPLIARELVYRCYGDLDSMPSAMDALADAVTNGDFHPCMLLEDGRPRDFSFMHIAQYGHKLAEEPYPDFSALLDSFYTRRSKIDNMRHRTQALRKTVKSAHDRTVRKLALQREELARTADREQKRRYADLITANLYRAKPGIRSLEVEDFYEPDCPLCSIPLDPLLSPQKNAAAYYRQYNKAKTAEQYLKRLIAENEQAETYLSSVLDEIDRAESEQDIADIRAELTQTGYLKKQNAGKNANKRKDRPRQPWRYRSSTGIDISVGRSNAQNDQLTKNAHRGDLWLHVQKIHGSHVIVHLQGGEIDDQTLQEAACLAALHSQAGSGGKIPVDYTRVKFVRKPAGSLPGMVLYTDYNTITAEADEALANTLKIN